MLKENPNKISWYWLSANPAASSLILDEKNKDKICWYKLCQNPDSEVGKLIMKKENKNNIHWYSLVENTNPDIIDFIRDNKECLDDSCWHYFSKNPAIFELDYEKMKSNDNFKEFERELLEKVLEPSRVERNGGISYLQALFN